MESISQVAIRDSSNKKRSKKRGRAGLTLRAEAQLRQALLLESPSAPWVDAQFVRLEDVTANGEQIIYRFHNPKAFPVPGMVPCPKCGIPHPRGFAVSHGSRQGTALCLDHLPDGLHEAYGPSPSALSIMRVRAARVAIEDTKLPPENTAYLRRFIARQTRKLRDVEDKNLPRT